MVIRIDENTRDSFLPLVPEALKGIISEGEAFCLGCVRDDTAVGVLIFSVENSTGENHEVLAVLDLLWIATAESFRRQGVASELMEALSEIYEESPAEAVTCYIAQGMGFEDAEAFLEAWGFEFDRTDLSAMIVDKEVCRRQIREAEKKKTLSLAGDIVKPEGLVSVKDIPRLKFKKAIAKLLENEDSAQYRHVFDDRDIYDGGVSFAIMRDNEISSLILFERRSTSELRMLMLKAMPSAGAKELLSLLHYAAASYYLNEPEETIIWFTMGTKQSFDLAKHIFPDRETVFIHTGYYR
ncbi:MAG: GNAT family N-acetyltransferase [Lachnospiraceae bacterium]|nr:GNAT family N-acetyltransferase [Lachnospiraceae bacterium]